MSFSPEGRGGNEVSEQPEQGHCMSSDLPAMACANKRETELFVFFILMEDVVVLLLFSLAVYVVGWCYPAPWAGWLGRDSIHRGSGERSPLSKCGAGFGMCCCVLLSSVRLCPPPSLSFISLFTFYFPGGCSAAWKSQLGVPALGCPAARGARVFLRGAVLWLCFQSVENHGGL